MRVAVAVAASLLFAAASARASDHDEQVWTSLTASTGLSSRLDATLEVHARYTDEVSRLGQLLVRPSVTLRLPRSFSLTAGYVYFRNDPRGGAVMHEHRAWEQVAYTLRRADSGPLITGRTRLEQRFRVRSNDTGWRVRQQLRFQSPIRRGEQVAALVWNETFIGLNGTRWGARAGLDQVRTFIGLNIPIAKGLAVEPGYLNQTVFRPGPDRINHIAAANVVARF